VHCEPDKPLAVFFDFVHRSSSFVCDGKISFIVNVVFVMRVLNVTRTILLCFNYLYMFVFICSAQWLNVMQLVA
jgi:hypothetical protein